MQLWNFREPTSAWTHFAALMVVSPGMLLLLRRGDGLGKRISLLIYGLSLVLCYSASTLYHGVRVDGDRLGFFVRLDSVGIFALIAGTYTPMAWNLMGGWWRIGTLSAVWGTAISSILLIASGRRFSPVMGTGIYLVMGWGCVVCYARISRLVPHRKLVPVVLGGVLYSVGAVLNLLRWPTLWPDSFGTHDLFHLFVIGGSLAHFWFILDVVVPFEGGPGEAPRPDTRPTGTTGTDLDPTD